MAYRVISYARFAFVIKYMYTQLSLQNSLT